MLGTVVAIEMTTWREGLLKSLLEAVEKQEKEAWRSEVRLLLGVLGDETREESDEESVPEERRQSEGVPEAVLSTLLKKKNRKRQRVPM